MKIEKKTTTVEQVEVQIPHYTKNSAHVYKIYSPEHCISITDLVGHYSIVQAHAALALSDGNTECNASEYEEALKRVSEIITSF